MSSRRYVPPLRIKLQPSRILTTFIITSHVLTFGVLWILPVQGSVIFLLLLVLLMSTYASLKKYIFERYRIHEIIYDSDGDWKLLIGHNEEIFVDLQADSYRHPFLSILNFRTVDNKKYSVILLPDNVDRESFRKLRVLLF